MSRNNHKKNLELEPPVLSEQRMQNIGCMDQNVIDYLHEQCPTPQASNPTRVPQYI
jgi:hypothetical protein